MISVRNIMLTASATILLLTACGKDEEMDEVNTASGFYKSANVVINDPIKMYTQSGVITDTMIIHDLLLRKAESLLFYLQPGTYPVKSGMTIYIDPYGENSYVSNWGFKELYSIVSEDNKITVMLSHDTLERQYAPYLTSDLSSLVNNAFQYQAPWGFGEDWTLIYPSKYRARKKHIIIEKGDHYITYPLISYYIERRYGSDVYSEHASSIHNYFNESMLGQLGNTDTLIVWTSRLKLVKQFH